MLFSSAVAARKCLAALEKSAEKGSSLAVVRFFLPPESAQGMTSFHWANFSAVLYPPDLLKIAMAFWRDTGSGLSTRHAEFCIGEFEYLDCDSKNPDFQSPAPSKRGHHGIPQTLACVQNAANSMPGLKSVIAKQANSDQPGEAAVSPEDVFLYPTGMNAIFSLSESLSSMKPDSNVAAFGYDWSHLPLVSLCPIRNPEISGLMIFSIVGCTQRLSMYCGRMFGRRASHTNTAQKKS
jgi:cystathionine gamma-synthase